MSDHSIFSFARLLSLRCHTLVIILALHSIQSAGADFQILSLDRHGELTWPSFGSNAIYGLERSLFPDGPWIQHFFANGTNGTTQISNQTSAFVPTNVWPLTSQGFYRLVWLNPPPLMAPSTNRLNYTAFGSNSLAVVTGKLDVVFFPNRTMSGTWDLQTTDPHDTNWYGRQIGHGELAGGVVTNSLHLDVSLEPGLIGGGAVWLRGNLLPGVVGGQLVYLSFTGNWSVDSEFGPRPYGRFQSYRETSE